MVITYHSTTGNCFEVSVVLLRHVISALHCFFHHDDTSPSLNVGHQGIHLLCIVRRKIAPLWLSQGLVAIIHVPFFGRFILLSTFSIYVLDHTKINDLWISWHRESSSRLLDVL